MRKLLLSFFFLILVGTLFYFSPFAQFSLPKVLLSGRNQVDERVASAKIRTPFWKPDPPQNPSKEAPPIVSAKSAYVVNITSNSLLFSKNPDLQLPVASLQKIITSMVTLDHMNPNQYTTITQYASGKEPDSMGLYPGEKLSLKQLLYGALLVSGNDAAIALAEATAGSEVKFVPLMNQKAEELGLNNTHFINSTGLDEGYQYSSAFDMAAFSMKLIRDYPLLRQISAAKEVSFPFTVTETENHKDYYLVNTSPTVNLEGYLGIKPGFTPEAGKCLITLVERNSNQYLIVVLGSEDRKGDTESLLDFAGKVS